MDTIFAIGNVSRNMEAFRQHFIELRKEYNLSQDFLADELKIPRGTIAGWEAGIRVPKSSQLLDIAYYFDVTVDYLFGFTEGKKESRGMGDPENKCRKNL